MSNLIAQSGIPKLYWCPSPFNSIRKSVEYLPVFHITPKILLVSSGVQWSTSLPQDIQISSATPATLVLQLLRWVVISPCCGLSRSHLAHMEPLRGWSARMVRGWFPGAFCGSHECQKLPKQKLLSRGSYLLCFRASTIQNAMALRANN